MLAVTLMPVSAQLANQGDAKGRERGREGGPKGKGKE